MRALMASMASSWDDVVRRASEASGQPRGATLFLLGLALAPAIALGFPILGVALDVARVRDARVRARVRSSYALVAGSALSLACFGRSTMVCAHFGVASYLVMAAARRRCGGIVFAGSFAYLIRYHMMADTANTWKRGEVDISGLLMVLVLKVSACAMNYQDGATTPASEMSEFQNRRHLKRLPSVLDYASWLMFPCTLVSGPTIEFRDYANWLRDEGVWEGARPSAARAALKKLLGAIACLGMYQAISSKYTIANTYLDPDFDTKYSFLERVWHHHVYGQGNRLKYYFVWMMADFATTVSGLGFSGFDALGNACWDTAANIYPWGVEKSVTLNSIPLNWNVKTGLWLRHYVYDRVTPKGKKPGMTQLLITQIVSGVWHGLYAGYWLFFVTSAFAVNGGRLMYRWKQTRVPARLRSLVDVPLWIFTQLALNYLCAAFTLVDLRQSVAAWKSVYFYGHVGFLVTIVLGALLAPKSKSKSKTA